MPRLHVEDALYR